MTTVVLGAYRDAWRQRQVFFGVHLLARLLAYAVISLLLGGAINLTESLSSRSALTDQDIAGFILTPVGLVVAAMILGTLLVADVAGFAVMTVVLRIGDDNGWRALDKALVLVGRRSRRLAVVALGLVLRVGAITAPFAAAVGLVAWHYLGEYDITYYLSAHPPAFIRAVALGALIVLVMVVVLLNRLVAWSLVVHLALFSDLRPGAVFAASAAAMEGRRQLRGEIAIWLLARLALMVVLAALTAAAATLIPVALGGSDLRGALIALALLAGLWTLAGLFLSALALGALAVLLNPWFEASGMAPVGDAETVAGPRFSLPGVALALLALALVGIGGGAALLDRLRPRDTVQIIAHRGAAGARPENTLASVGKAIEDGTDWVEIDVQETADGQVVVAHDRDLTKLAGVDLTIRDATMADLAGIDVGSWFDPIYADQRTPLLSDVLSLAKGRAKVLIELKYYGHDMALADRVADIVDGLGMADQVAVMSLKYPMVQRMIALRPDWRIGVLAATAVGDLTGLQGDFVAVDKAMATPGRIRRVEAAGKFIYVWTVNDPLEMSAMISRGVDGLITDEPGLARKLLAFRATLSAPERLFLALAGMLGLDLNTRVYRDNSP